MPLVSPLDPPLNGQTNLKIVSRYYRFSNNTKHWKKTEPLRVGPWVAGLLCRNSKVITNSVTHMFTYIGNRICFSFHFKFPFSIYRWKQYVEDVSTLPTFFADSSTPSSQKTTNSTSTGQWCSGVVTKYSVAMGLIAMADSDLQIREGVVIQTQR